MTPADELALAIVRVSTPAPLLISGVGVLRFVGASTDGVVEVSGVTAEPFTVPRSAWSSVFIAEVQTNGAALNGRRVKVDIVASQPVIAYTIGD